MAQLVVHSTSKPKTASGVSLNPAFGTMLRYSKTFLLVIKLLKLAFGFA